MAALAFVFAGQGAQYPGMGRELYESSAAASEIFDRAEAIRPGTLEMCFSGAAADLSQTINTQPCLFAMDFACAAATLEAGVKPACCAGFSLGEIPAAAFAGVMDFEQAFRFVIRRAEAMQACAQKEQGAMGAVLRLIARQVEDICAEFPEQAYPVNYNCPGQTVVACKAEIFDRLSARIADEKGRMMKLNVSGAFHSPWMADASAQLQEYLAGEQLDPAKMDFYANYTAEPYGENAAELLYKQVCNPVRWQETIENMIASGVDTFVELGAGKTLSGLIRKINSNVRVLNVEKAADLEKLKEVADEG